MDSYAVLYNTKAGHQKNRKKINRLKRLLKNDYTEYYDILTIHDYSEFINSLAPGQKILIAGGDGTLNHFINDFDGLYDGIDIYYYPSGSGNDFYNDICKSRNPRPIFINKYLKHLPTVTIGDYTCKFINGIGFGMDGYCCEKGDLQRAKHKKVNYTSIALKGLAYDYNPCHATICVDNTYYEYDNVWIAPAMNGKYYGGGMMATPMQDRLNPDCTLTVMIMTGTNKIRMLSAFPSVFFGKHTKYTSIVKFFTGHEISVEFDRPNALQIDGETFLNVTKYTARSSKCFSQVKSPL